jgi:hypothetical protein
MLRIKTTQLHNLVCWTHLERREPFFWRYARSCLLLLWEALKCTLSILFWAWKGTVMHTPPHIPCAQPAGHSTHYPCAIHCAACHPSSTLFPQRGLHTFSVRNSLYSLPPCLQHSSLMGHLFMCFHVSVRISLCFLSPALLPHKCPFHVSVRNSLCCLSPCLPYCFLKGHSTHSPYVNHCTACHPASSTAPS